MRRILLASQGPVPIPCPEVINHEEESNIKPLRFQRSLLPVPLLLRPPPSRLPTKSAQTQTRQPPPPLSTRRETPRDNTIIHERSSHIINPLLQIIILSSSSPISLVRASGNGDCSGGRIIDGFGGLGLDVFFFRGG